jgi:hypothetical protein
VSSSRVELAELVSKGIGSNIVPPLVISRLVLTLVMAVIVAIGLASYLIVETTSSKAHECKEAGLDREHRSHEAISSVKRRVEQELDMLEVVDTPLHIHLVPGSRPKIGHEQHKDPRDYCSASVPHEAALIVYMLSSIARR